MSILNLQDELTAFEDRYAVLRADSAEEVGVWMDQNFGPWQADVKTVEATSDVARFARKDIAEITLATYRWQACLEARIEAGQNVLFIAFPVEGQVRMHVEDAGPVEPGPRQARVYRRSVPHRNMISPGYANLSLVVPVDLLERRARSYYDLPADRPLAFCPLLDLDRPQGAAVLGLVRHMVRSLNADPCAYDNALIRATLRDMVGNVLLANLTHNAAEGASKRAAFPLPRTVRQAEDFMRANAHRPISVEDLAKAAGCSERALHDGFKRFRGKTPMITLRDIRLEGARRDLERETESVTQIAFKWGFSNPGRFAQAYANAFGEKPSQTRRRTTASLPRRSDHKV